MTMVILLLLIIAELLAQQAVRERKRDRAESAKRDARSAKRNAMCGICGWRSARTCADGCEGLCMRGPDRAQRRRDESV